MTQEAIDSLSSHYWPGNVRQLRNEIERVVAYAPDGARISIDDLSPEVAHPRRQMRQDRPQQGHANSGSLNGGRFPERTNGNGINGWEAGAGRAKLKEAIAELERKLIHEALGRNKNNLSRTAIDLGLSRRGLRLKLAQLGISKEHRAENATA
jgi:DNA-binding NtrC family response regulator